MEYFCKGCALQIKLSTSAKLNSRNSENWDTSARHDHIISTHFDFSSSVYSLSAKLDKDTMFDGFSAAAASPRQISFLLIWTRTLCDGFSAAAASPRQISFNSRAVNEQQLQWFAADAHEE